MLSDTSPEAESVWIELWRNMTPTQRLQRALNLSQTVIDMSKHAVHEANPDLSEAEFKLLWIELTYGPDLARKVRDHLSQHASPQR